MRVSRILLVLVAIVAAGLAAFLALGGGFNQPVPEAPPRVVAEVPKTQVLVASADIGLGERLTAKSLRWQDWPDNALQAGYIISRDTPNAIDQMKDTVARFELFKGEPIQQAKLVHADQGYMSAVLDKGKRGISISVAAESASGGFIVPNDHVDVILTRSGANGEQTSETLLANVRVLAINTRLGETGKTGAPDNSSAEDTDSGDGPKSQIFNGGAIATLELDPIQAETIVNASQLGRLSLALRSIADFAQTGSDDDKIKRNAAIRIIRYGQTQSITTGQVPSADGGDAAVNPAAFQAPTISVGTTVTPD